MRPTVPNFGVLLVARIHNIPFHTNIRYSDLEIEIEFHGFVLSIYGVNVLKHVRNVFNETFAERIPNMTFALSIFSAKHNTFRHKRK